MAISFEDDGVRRLTALLDGKPVGRVDYFALPGGEDPEREPAVLVGIHTEVDPEHQGRGVAGALAAEFYRLAAAGGRAVVPLCPYLKKWAEAHPGQAPAVGTELVRSAARHLRQDPSLW